jgi:hypothetical protein
MKAKQSRLSQIAALSQDNPGPMRRLSKQLAATFALALGLAGCGSGGGSAPPVTVSSPPAPTTTATKTPIKGLVTMGSLGFNNQVGGLPDNGMQEINAHPGVYSAAVINVLWSRLEPQQNVFDDSAISSALKTVATYNATYPATPVVAKLRINAGIGTPNWVMQLTGGPISIAGNAGTIQIGAFWSASYRSAWKALQAHLSSEFDTTSDFAEVEISSCSSRTDEPFIASLDASSLAAMRQYGFSDSSYMACLTDALNDYSGWKNTPLDFSFNAYRNSDGSSLVENPSFTISVMDAFRSRQGSQAVVANHGLQNPLSNAAMPIYTEFQNLGPAIEFQAIAPTVDWPSAIQLGLTYKPTEIEIWQTVAAGGQANLSQSQLQQWANDLK